MTRIIGPIARATLLEAMRSRMLWLVGVLLVLSLAAAGFLGQVAIIEAAEIRVTVVAALLRAAAAFLTAAFVVMSMVRESNDKVLELMLAQPWPRAAYLFGKLVGFTAMSLFCVITLAHIVPALAAVLGFYVLARSIAALQLIASAAETSTLWTDRAANWIVHGIALVLPRLDEM